jgi:HEAT repeat protein
MASSREDTLRNQQQKIEARDGSTIEDVSQTTVHKLTAENVHIGPTYTHTKQEELNNHLAHAVAAYKGHLYQAVAQFSRPSSPYKLLSPFRIEDAAIFYGRTNAVEELCKKVFQSRLLVMHAKSGAGKTSLLNAGLFPCIIRQGCLPLYIHTYDKDPVWVIKQALVSATLGAWPDGLSDLSLHEFLAYICTHLKHDNIEELLIALDQFEDFFLYWTQPSDRVPFIKALGNCYSDQTLPIRIIIALRKDYYSDLAEFDEILAHIHIFQNNYRPSPMTQQEVKEAIVQPLKKLDSTVAYDSTLLDTLITELSRNEIELPLLQIICTRLYETAGKGKKRITLKTYEDLGKTEGVLNGYLNEVLAGLPEKEKILAKDILKELVRSDLTKQALSEGKLMARVGSTRNEFDRTLAQLTHARLLYRDDIEGEIRYELVHEYLTTEIVKWIDTANREFKRAEELLRSELATWRSYGHLIFLERLELLYPYRERFKGLGAKDWECLLRSAIKAESDVGDKFLGTDVTDWVKAVHNIDATLLLKAIVEPLIAQLQDKDSDKRQEAAEGLAMIGKDGDLRAAVEPLIAELQNGNWEAANALGKIGDGRAVEPLIAALQDKDSTIRRSAASGLGELRDERAVEPLIAALQDEKSYVRFRAASSLGELRDERAVEPLIASLQDKDSGVREYAAIALGEFGDSHTVEPLIAELQNGNWGAANALGKIGDGRAVEPLIAALQVKNNILCQKAAEALEKLGDARAVEPLIAILRHKDDQVRWQIVRTLGELADIRAVEPLIVTLQDEDSDVRACAAWALGEIGDSCAVESLIASLQDKDSGVREYAAWALGKIGDSQAVEPLIASLQDKDSNVRTWTAWALGKIGGTRVVEPLIIAGQDEDINVKKYAVQALENIQNGKRV